VFMGSPEFAVPSLRSVAERHQVLAVVTQPDRPRGRGRALAPPAVKVAARELGLTVLQFEKLRRRSVRQQLTELGADLFVVAAYGKILSAKMLAVPPMGCVNVHASLLPKYRGAAPIQWAVIRGEKQSGITIMQMDEGMDTGPMYLQQAIDLEPGETGGSLHDRLAPLGAELLIRTLEGIAAGALEPTPQQHDRASMAPMLSKEHGQLDLSLPGRQVDCWIRGLDPWPGAYTLLDGKPLKLFASSLLEGYEGHPGEVLGADRRGLLVACGSDAVCISELQLPGRKRLAVQALLAGRPIPTGTLLGQ
jgi:methionyl-tRNA formyltransferase